MNCRPWSDLEEVIERANNSNAGLGASVWSKNAEKAQEVAQRLEAGNVFVNSWVKPIAQVFFSGHKESGIGGEWGKQGLSCRRLEVLSAVINMLVPRNPVVLQCSCHSCLQINGCKCEKQKGP